MPFAIAVGRQFGGAIDKVGWSSTVQYTVAEKPDSFAVTLALILLLLILAGCSAVTAGKCAPAAAEFKSKSEHKSMVLHPRGCYAAWDQELSSFEAERLALLACSEANPKSDDRCRVVATDDHICPRSLETWVEEQRRNEGAAEPSRQCEFGKTFVVKSAPGTVPPPVDRWTGVSTKDVAAFFGLGDYVLDASDAVGYGSTPESRSNWVLSESLHFVKRRDGKALCALRVASGWDPTEYFDTEFRVNLLACFAIAVNGTGSGQG